jgi:predicted acyl esterase
VTYRYDPADPTPSIGGPICCTGGLDLPAVLLDQGANAGRGDVLAFTSDPLDAPITLMGEVTADVILSSDAPDTDLVAVRIDAGPDGSLLAIQQGALRLRYRNGFDAPAPVCNRANR